MPKIISKETRKKMSLAKIGKKRPDMVGNTLRLGKKPSPAHLLKLKKLRESKPELFKPWLGKKMTKEHRMKMSLSAKRGEENPLWKGGSSSINKKLRSSIEYKFWREAVFARDKYTCVWCGDDKGGNLNADHIKPFAYFPELRFAIDNGRTLCIPCHKTTDSFMGRAKKNYYNKS